LRAGHIHPVHRGIYSVGHKLLSGHGRWMAAVLACGDAALLSHQCAAALWEILPSSRGVIDVTVPTHRRRPGIVVHQSGCEDRTVKSGIPVTTVARTLLDLAEVVPHRLDRAVEEAERLRLFDLRAIETLLHRSQGRRGVRTLEAALAAYREPPVIRSKLERRFLDICREAGLPTPAANAFVGRYEVDALWRDRRLIVEVDSHDFHRTRAAFERDRLRDTHLQLAGYRVLRVTDRRLATAPDEVIGAVRSLLAT
jgi:hypothetical protein